MSKLQDEAQYLKGVGPKWAGHLRKLGLVTFRDVLFHFPRRYEDRRNLPPMRDLKAGEFATVKGDLIDLRTRPTRGGRVLLTAVISDGTGQVKLIWFNQPWMKKKLENYTNEIIAYGMVRQEDWAMQIQNPEIEIVEDEEDLAEFARIVPVYPLTEGLPQKVMRRAAESALNACSTAVLEPLTREFRARYDLKELQWSLRQIHQPDTMITQKQARKRLVFEEFFYMQLAVQMRRLEAKQELGIAFDLEAASGAGTLFGGSSPSSLEADMRKMLPFELTGAQKRVIQEIWADMGRPVPMNRLIQGDVGSGKTAVAACAMLASVRNNYQAAMMAPTEILAEQHAAGLRRFFDPLGIHVVLITGRLSAPAKRKALQQAESGEAQIIVGTHALISEGVKFARLGLAVVDEQHRFGVMQRAALRQKGDVHPDVLVMTATPIPRTLTMTFYGDLDVSIIDELPPGRVPIKTFHKQPHDRAAVYKGIRKFIEEGRQAYVVCPNIEESEKVQTQAAKDLHYRLSEDTFPDLRVGLLHGQMKSAEKDEVMDAFRKGELDILVATVVIEVGVDVPNASVMVIEDANRFGLAQLHQLRGRVGRGEHSSYCVLIADARSPEAYERMRIMTETTDGFKISEADLRLRGPGEIAGTKQSGNLDLRLADLVQDAILLEQARQAAMDMLAEDPNLSLPDHARLLARVKEERRDVAMVVVS